MSGRERLTGHDVLQLLHSEPCPRPGCDGVLELTTYKDTDALVCRECETPTVRVRGEQ